MKWINYGTINSIHLNFRKYIDIDTTKGKLR